MSIFWGRNSMSDLIKRVHLDNGLLVLLKEIHTAPLISQWIWYRVGSRDESPGKTGISHWTEHMQFKGTHKFPNGVLDKAISRFGGYWNAMTSLDWTTYYETMPSDKIDIALHLEADRMVNSQFLESDVESERLVVISERQGNENSPFFRLSEAVQAAAFKVHPYHHEVIGDMVDLKSIERDDLYQHYRNYYIPNNAVLSIAGSFETDNMLKRIRDLYEPIRPGDEPERQNRNEPVQKFEHQLTVEGPGETTFIEAAYRVPSASQEDFIPLNVLSSLLTGASNISSFGNTISNKTSRLFQALVENEVAVSVSGGLQATIDPFLYSIFLVVHPERSTLEAVDAIDKEILRLQKEPPSEEELAKAVKQARALFAYGSESITNQALWLGLAEMFANYDWFLTYLDRLEAVTPDTIQRIAQDYLLPQNRVLGTYKPGKDMGSE
jgi:zinc protease